MFNMHDKRSQEQTQNSHSVIYSFFHSWDEALGIPIPAAISNALLRQSDPVREIHTLPAVLDEITNVLVISLIGGGEDIPVVLTPELIYIRDAQRGRFWDGMRNGKDKGAESRTEMKKCHVGRRERKRERVGEESPQQLTLSVVSLSKFASAA